MKLKFGKSIYQNEGYKGNYDIGNGSLTVRDGRLINNRPTGQTGIAEAAQMRKAAKKAEKIYVMSEAVALGSMKEDMMGGSHCDY